MLVPRPYQEEALDALHRHICEHSSNPCVVIPTGGGKSAVIAWAIQRWKKSYAPFRCIILAHRRELIEQNAEEFQRIFPDAARDVGIYSAAINRRDRDASILFASIDSVSKRAGEFAPWHIIMVDEAHRIPFKGEGKYRRFIAESKKLNNELRVVGFTATPFRMTGGDICHEDHILNEVCYEAGVMDLIDDGFLCNLRSKVGEAHPDMDGVSKSRGDYVIKQASSRAIDVVESAVSESLRIIKNENRKSVIFFCVDVKHCKAVSESLARMNFRAPVITAKTPQEEREKISNQFKEGKIPGVCNVNVFTEGFNAKGVDCIVLLRPTLSTGLYSQMVGRGLRSLDGKRDCLVLDYASCIAEHGPIDCLGGLPTVMAVCSECREGFSRAIGACPACGWELPKIEVKRLAAEESEKRMHGARASSSPILSAPMVHEVHAVFIARHKKKSKPDSIRISYRCGSSMFTEWVCPDHSGYAAKKAGSWLASRGLGPGSSVNALLSDMFFAQKVKEWTNSITVIKEKRIFSIVGYNEPPKELA